MRYYEYGKENEKTILLLPGTLCSCEVNFGGVVGLLAERFHVIGVDYDGFDGSGRDFTSMYDITEKIERYIKKNFGGEVFAAYGSSLGGSFVGLLIQRGNIHISHGIIGSSDLDQSGRFSAFLQTKIIGNMLYGTLKSGNIPTFMKKIMKSKFGDEAAEKYLSMVNGISRAMVNTSKLSLEREFYSDLITPLDDGISAEGTVIHVFYALKMGEKYRRRYLEHFAEPDIIGQDFGHEELLFFYPEKWVGEVIKCVGAD